MIIVGVVNGPDRSHDMFPLLSGAKAKTYPTAGGADAFAAFLAVGLAAGLAPLGATQAAMVATADFLSARAG